MYINNRAELHDTTLQHLLNNNYHYFKAPMYLIDQELNPLREVIKNYSAGSAEEYNLVWKAAWNTNEFYQELHQRFSQHINNTNFISKAGDFIIDINNDWHMIELKTTTKGNDIYNFNFDSFRAYNSLPLELRNFIHILFYNDLNKSFWIGRFNDLKFQSTCYVYSEISPERHYFIRSYDKFYDIKYNDNQNVAPHIDKTQNAYVKIDLNEQAFGVLSSIPDHMNKLKYHNTNVNLTPITQ